MEVKHCLTVISRGTGLDDVCGGMASLRHEMVRALMNFSQRQECLCGERHGQTATVRIQ